MAEQLLFGNSEQALGTILAFGVLFAALGLNVGGVPGPVKAAGAAWVGVTLCGGVEGAKAMAADFIYSATTALLGSNPLVLGVATLGLGYCAYKAAQANNNKAAVIAGLAAVCTGWCMQRANQLSAVEVGHTR